MSSSFKKELIAHIDESPGSMAFLFGLVTVAIFIAGLLVGYAVAEPPPV